MKTKNLRETFYYLLIGMFMGIADTIPGVSAGTVAFISGIYNRLLSALTILDYYFFKDFFCFKWGKIFKRVDYLFLLPLSLGLLTSLILTANLIHFLLLNHPLFLWSFFFGLVFFSTLLLTKKISFSWLHLFIFISGILAGYFIAGSLSLQTPNENWFLVLCGFIAISSLLLPGISGAFVLVLLGKYDLVISAIKNPFLSSNAIILFYFYIGALMGLLVTSHFLRWVIKNWENLALSFLTGLTLGSLRKVWPWKEEVLLENSILVNNIIPTWNKQNIYAFFLLFIGTIFAFFIYKLPLIILKKSNE